MIMESKRVLTTRDECNRRKEDKMTQTEDDTTSCEFIRLNVLYGKVYYEIYVRLHDSVFSITAEVLRRSTIQKHMVPKKVKWNFNGMSFNGNSNVRIADIGLQDEAVVEGEYKGHVLLASECTNPEHKFSTKSVGVQTVASPEVPPSPPPVSEPPKVKT